MERSAIYIDIAVDESKRDLRHIFNSICGNFIYYDKPGEALKIIKDAINSSKKELGLVILDVRGVEKALDVTRNFIRWIQDHYPTQRLMLIYDKGLESKLPELCSYNIDFLIPDPWSKELMARVIGRLRRDTSEISEDRCVESAIDEIKSLFDNYETFKRLAQTQSSFFLSKSRKLDSIINDIKNINTILLQIDWDEQHGGLISRLFRDIEKLDKTNSIIREYVQKYTKELEESDYFDINLLLNVIYTELQSELSRVGVEMIYKISNRVPAKLYGVASIIKKSIIDSIHLLIATGIEERVILHIDTKGSENSLKLKIGFRSLKSIVDDIRVRLSRMQKSAEVKKLVALVENYGGSIIFDKSSEDILTLEFPTKISDTRSYRLPKKELMHKRVLLIDEDLDTSDSLKEMLEYFHFLVDTAYDWESAEGYIKRFEYDIIYVMHKFHSDTLKSLKMRASQSRVVATADRDSKLNKDIESSRSILYKPYTQQAIFDTILDIYYNDSTHMVQEAIDAYKHYIDLMVEGRKSVIVSRDYSDRMAIELMLEGTGLEVRAYSKIGEGIDELPEADILILNLNDIVKDFRELQMVVELISGYDMYDKTVGMIDKSIEDIEELKETTGITHIIKKPIDPEEFYRLLTEHLIFE